MENSTSAKVARSPSGPWEWLWRGRAIAAARAEASSEATSEGEYRRRAELAAELGDRAIDPIDALRAGSSVPLAFSLYRQAAYWGLLANGSSPGASDLREAFDSAPAGLLQQAGGGEQALALLRTRLVESDFADDAEEPVDRLVRDARPVQAFVGMLIERATPSSERLQTLLFERWFRLALVFALLFGCGFELKTVVQRALTAPDLALGKPWRTSSKWADCHPEQQECGGAHTAVLFHTLEDDQPWFEIDLQSPQRIASVEVKNRSDCCPDRAIPLVIEVGIDQQHFREVARQKQPFDEWDAKFAPVTARYVRVRVARRSTLHLEHVSVRAR